MCLMEKEFPPSFIDIVAHLPNYIVEEAFFVWTCSHKVDVSIWTLFQDIKRICEISRQAKR